MKKSKTNRGFELYEFTDKYGEKCSLQESSIATEDCIWLGIDDAKPKILASQAKEFGLETHETTGWIVYPIHEEVSLNTRMHISREQVKELISILNTFVKTGAI
jgi:hypothetical protein